MNKLSRPIKDKTLGTVDSNGATEAIYLQNFFGSIETTNWAGNSPSPVSWRTFVASHRTDFVAQKDISSVLKDIFRVQKDIHVPQRGISGVEAVVNHRRTCGAFSLSFHSKPLTNPSKFWKILLKHNFGTSRPILAYSLTHSLTHLRTYTLIDTDKVSNKHRQSE